MDVPRNATVPVEQIDADPLTAGRRNNALAAEAAAEADAGIGIPVIEIARWVDSWDTPDELPMPSARKLR